jgi:hypothetical protein
VIKGVNDDQVFDIVKYGLKKRFINSIVFRPYNLLGKKGFPGKDRLNPTDIISVLEEKTMNQGMEIRNRRHFKNHRESSKITVTDVTNFMKILYVVSDIFNIKICQYNRYYLLFRSVKKGSSNFQTPADMMKLGMANKLVRNYKKIQAKSGLLSFLYSLTFIRLLKPGSIKWVFLSIYYIMTSFFHRNAKLPEYIMPVKFTLNCDPIVFDHGVSSNCTMRQYRKDYGMKLSAYMNLTNERYLKKN